MRVVMERSHLMRKIMSAVTCIVMEEAVMTNILFRTEAEIAPHGTDKKMMSVLIDIVVIGTVVISVLSLLEGAVFRVMDLKMMSVLIDIVMAETVAMSALSLLEGAVFHVMDLKMVFHVMDLKMMAFLICIVMAETAAMSALSLLEGAVFRVMKMKKKIGCYTITKRIEMPYPIAAMEEFQDPFSATPQVSRNTVPTNFLGMHFLVTVMIILRLTVLVTINPDQ